MVVSIRPSVIFKSPRAGGNLQPIGREVPLHQRRLVRLAAEVDPYLTAAEAEFAHDGSREHHSKKSIGVRFRAYRPPAQATDDAAVRLESLSLDRDPEPG
jgi:hypothetical protein